jgi:hypothetical protein
MPILNVTQSNGENVTLKLKDIDDLILPFPIASTMDCGWREP